MLTIQYPGMLMLLLGFMIFPLITSGQIQEKAAEMIASLIGAVLAFAPIMIIYVVVLTIFKFIFT